MLFETIFSSSFSQYPGWGQFLELLSEPKTIQTRNTQAAKKKKKIGEIHPSLPVVVDPAVEVDPEVVLVVVMVVLEVVIVVSDVVIIDVDIVVFDVVMVVFSVVMATVVVVALVALVESSDEKDAGRATCNEYA